MQIRSRDVQSSLSVNSFSEDSELDDGLVTSKKRK